MTNDRAAGKPALPSQIAGKILENPFAGAQLDWSLGCNGIDLAQDGQQLLQRGPIGRFRTGKTLASDHVPFAPTLFHEAP
jgi:hypothetical protein